MKQYFKNTIGLIAIFLLLISCKSETEKQWEKSAIATKLFELEERGWKANQILRFADDIQYRATEVPIEYYLLKNQGLSNTKKFDSIALSNTTQRVVEFEFEQSAAKDLLLEDFTQKAYDDGVIYMAGTIQKDFKVITSSGREINCVGVLFERHFKVSPFKRVMLYFDGIDPSESIKLIYSDALFGKGTFEFDFGQGQLKL